MRKCSRNWSTAEWKPKLMAATIMTGDSGSGSRLEGIFTRKSQRSYRERRESFRASHCRFLLRSEPLLQLDQGDLALTGAAFLAVEFARSCRAQGRKQVKGNVGGLVVLRVGVGNVMAKGTQGCGPR